MLIHTLDEDSLKPLFFRTMVQLHHDSVIALTILANPYVKSKLIKSARKRFFLWRFRRGGMKLTKLTIRMIIV